MSVERDPDRHRFAVPELMAGQPLQLVGRPVTEVQRPRRAHLERIAGGGDVVQMQGGGPVHDLLHRRQIAGREQVRPLLDEFEERVVLDQRGLHRFRQAAEPVAIGEGRQEKTSR